MTINVKATYRAPIDRVFQVFSDFQKIEERINGIKKIEFLEGDGSPVVGMKWRETRVMLGREATEDMWITEINENQNYVVEAESNGTKYRSEYVFSESNGVTEVTLIFTGTPVSWMASVGSVLGVLFKGSVVKALKADMEDLRKIIEE